MSLGLRRHVKCLTDVVAVGVWGLWVFPQARTQRRAKTLCLNQPVLAVDQADNGTRISCQIDFAKKSVSSSTS